MTTDSMTTLSVPLPEEQPTLRLWPEVGTILGLSRSSTYEAVQRGEIPVLRFGRRIVVPTAALRKMLGLELMTANFTRSVEDRKAIPRQRAALHARGPRGP